MTEKERKVIEAAREYIEVDYRADISHDKWLSLHRAVRELDAQGEQPAESLPTLDGKNWKEIEPLWMTQPWLKPMAKCLLDLREAIRRLK